MMMEYWRRMNLNNLIIVAFLFATSIFPQDCKSELIIKSDFDMVNIFINDSLVSSDGSFIGELNFGEYIIIADEISDRWNSKTFIDTLKIIDCNKRKLNFYFRNETIQQFNDNLNGDLNQGKYYLSDSAYEQITLHLPTITKKDKFINSTLFKVLAGSAIALGGVTAYYKIKADKFFDDYLATRDNSKLDQTKKYDLISGITLTAFQINFGYILMRFLLE